MKLKNSILIVAGFAIIIMAGCDVLNKEPKSAVSSKQVITDANSAQIALNGLYDKLQSNYSGRFYAASDLSADIAQHVGTYNFFLALDTYQTNVDNLALQTIWNGFYGTINQANFIIAKVKKLDKASKATKDRILGEAYFVRALCYFELNRSFGGVKGVYGAMGVPVVLKPTTKISKADNVSRPTINETYKRVESDLKEALSLLPSNSFKRIRATKMAAKALLSRLYLYYRTGNGNDGFDYKKVEDYATDVISNSNYQLISDYKKIFNKKENKGIIFEIAYNTSDGSNIRFINVPASEGGRGELALQPGLVQLMQSRPNDIRGQLIAYNDQRDDYYAVKYNKVSGANDVIILRMAEMYLNRAAARAHQQNFGGALSDLNEIRNRAGLPDTTITGSNAEEKEKNFLKAIAVERRIEFFEEGQRWYYVLRSGRALDVFQQILRDNSGPVSLPDKFHEVWPIPRSDVDANPNLQQNPGY